MKLSNPWIPTSIIDITGCDLTLDADGSFTLLDSTFHEDITKPIIDLLNANKELLFQQIEDKLKSYQWCIEINFEFRESDNIIIATKQKLATVGIRLLILKAEKIISVTSINPKNPMRRQLRKKIKQAQNAFGGFLEVGYEDFYNFLKFFEPDFFEIVKYERSKCLHSRMLHYDEIDELMVRILKKLYEWCDFTLISANVQDISKWD